MCSCFFFWLFVVCIKLFLFSLYFFLCLKSLFLFSLNLVLVVLCKIFMWIRFLFSYGLKVVVEDVRGLVDLEKIFNELCCFWVMILIFSSLLGLIRCLLKIFCCMILRFWMSFFCCFFSFCFLLFFDLILDCWLFFLVCCFLKMVYFLMFLFFVKLFNCRILNFR